MRKADTSTITEPDTTYRNSITVCRNRIYINKLQETHCYRFTEVPREEFSGPIPLFCI